MISYHRKSTKKTILLLSIIIFHTIAVFLAAYHDRTLHSGHASVVKITELKYWLWFFSWWSAWASLITVLWAIYKLVSKNKKSGYWGQLIDVIITVANLVSGIVFFFGGFLLAKPRTKPDKPTAAYPGLGEIRPIYFWFFYNFFWHLFAPGLVFYYFWKYSQVEKLKEKKKMNLINNFLSPLIYFFYLLLRAGVRIERITYVRKAKKQLPYSYPADYPYPNFYWIKGEYSGEWEKEKKDSKWFFWHQWPKWLQSFFWLSMTVILAYLGFSFFFNYLIKIKNRQKNQLIKEKKMGLLV